MIPARIPPHLLRSQPAPQLDREPPRIVAAMLAGAALIGCSIALLVWIALVPVWLAIVARAIAVFAGHSVLTLFSRRSMADIGRLEDAVGLWPNGVAVILATIAGRPPAPSPQPHDPWQLAYETGFAILFYLSLGAWWTYGSALVHLLHR